MCTLGNNFIKIATPIVFKIMHTICTKDTKYTFLSAFNNVLHVIEKQYCENKFTLNINVNVNDCGELALGYMENVVKTDLKQINKDIDFNEHKAKLILKSLARNESTTVSNQSILNDIIENDNSSISKNTLSKYLDAFNRMFLFNNQEPFSPNIRSSLRVKQMEKRHFSDPAMACAMLKLTPKKLMNDLNTFVDIEFENKLFPCFKEYDKFLSRWYGDYMKLPPEEERIIGHSYEVFYKE